MLALHIRHIKFVFSSAETLSGNESPLIKLRVARWRLPAFVGRPVLCYICICIIRICIYVCVCMCSVCFCCLISGLIRFVRGIQASRSSKLARRCRHKPNTTFYASQNHKTSLAPRSALESQGHAPSPLQQQIHQNAGRLIRNKLRFGNWVLSCRMHKLVFILISVSVFIFFFFLLGVNRSSAH